LKRTVGILDMNKSAADCFHVVQCYDLVLYSQIKDHKGDTGL